MTHLKFVFWLVERTHSLSPRRRGKSFPQSLSPFWTLTLDNNTVLSYLYGAVPFIKFKTSWDWNDFCFWIWIHLERISNRTFFVSNAARRLRVTHDKESATKFSEELIESNQYSKYKIANSNCFLTVRKNGKTQISCKENQSNSITFYEQKKLKVSGLKNDYYYAHNCLKQLQKIKAIN